MQFGTRFETLDSGKIKRTTKGIWLAQAEAGAEAETSTPTLLALDVEGWDSTDQQDDFFSRRCVLFALDAADVIIVNVLAVSVGWKCGAGIDLLQSVFDVSTN